MKKHSKSAKKWTHIDVDNAARSGGIERADAVRKLQEWHSIGAIELQPSGVVNRFRVLKEFPQGESAKHDMITAMYNQIEARERSDMDRVRGVIELITSQSCLNRELARHFGDQDSIPKEGCGHCNYCLTKKPISLIQGDKQQRNGRIDEEKIKAILSATKVRDDARFLARVAFGISSPRVTAEKLGKHAVFGSMDDCNFEVRAALSAPLGCNFVYTETYGKHLGIGKEIQSGVQIVKTSRHAARTRSLEERRGLSNILPTTIDGKIVKLVAKAGRLWEKVIAISKIIHPPILHIAGPWLDIPPRSAKESNNAAVLHNTTYRQYIPIIE